jgi:thiopeptide-type bacteriocin biosynthesis protein
VPGGELGQGLLQRRQAVLVEPARRRLLTVDASPNSPVINPGRHLAYLADRTAAFNAAGTALSHLVRDGTLHRGVRAVLTHHLIFHGNRIGLPYQTQSILAHTAKAVVLGE